MKEFIFAYHGGSAPTSEEEAKQVIKRWSAWLGSLGAAVVDGGNPVGKSQTVHADKSLSNDGGANPLSGYSIIRADDAGVAAELAMGCPILDEGGSIEIAPMVKM